MNSDLALAHVLADHADQISMKRFGALDLKIDTKPDLTPVSDADTSVEQEIRKLINGTNANDSIVGEEFGQEGNSNREWILDPIDGTKNFVRGVPFWGTLIGLKIDGVMQMGMVSAPAIGKRWFASKGNGAFVRSNTNSFISERRISVSKVAKLEDSYLGYSSQDRWHKKNQEEEFNNLLKKAWRARGFGDFIIHMLVAEGALDFSVEPELAVWDMAALIPIVQEAGGIATSLTGGESLVEKSLITSNGLLHPQLLKVFN